ncbi:pancreatic triacylglycerol lipase-like [Chironomus tepperi]|uniref:pancreatic triacylglycerol lipase-like n=1 Tax=Chironomus tepperi TaxID=113505 RepID=UPI00391F9A1E
MKSFVLIACILFAGVSSLPVDDTIPRWNALSDDTGRMKLVDLNPLEVEPEPMFNPQTDIIFLLFTRRNPTVGQRITFDLNTVRNSNWNSNNGVRFIIHGWQSDQTTALNIFIRDEFLANGDHNVVVVDWSAGAQTINYISARNRVGVTGGTVALLIDDLHRNGLLNFNNVHIVGHSLGSHVAGNAGKQVTRGRIPVIFATDPAGPLFSATDADRLSPNDAIYTEALHTNAGTLGYAEPITDASFYPNWGSSQPGCGLDVTGACAHERSNLFYSESVRGTFTARQCANYVQITSRNCPGTGVTGRMGGDVQKNLSGVFFLTTNSASPFSQG